MRVAVLTEWWPSLACKHEGIFVRDQVEALSAHHDMQVIAVHPAAGSRAWRYGRFALKAIREFDRLNAQKRFDLIHAHEAFPCGWLANELGYWSGIPSVITVHSSPFPISRKWPEARASVDAVAKADATIAVSGLTQSEAGCERVIGNIVDRRFYEMQAPQLPDKRTQRKFLFVGSFCQRKGVDAILDAINYVNVALGRERGWEFVLMGDGPMWYEVVGRTRGIAGVRVLPPHDRAGVLGWMSWADVLVAPSRHESFGLAAIEAAVAGRPVIVGEGTATDAILQEDGNPVAVNGAAIAQAMFGDLASPDRNRIYGQFNAYKVASQINAVYEHVVQKRLRRRPGQRLMEASA